MAALGDDRRTHVCVHSLIIMYIRLCSGSYAATTCHYKRGGTVASALYKVREFICLIVIKSDLFSLSSAIVTFVSRLQFTYIPILTNASADDDNEDHIPGVRMCAF